jgi:phosphotriesterase-related protein
MGLVRTVLGDVEPRSLGVTSCHEHIVLGIEYSGIEEDTLGPEHVIPDLEVHASLGAHTIIEMTNMGLGRDASALRDISERSGLNIVCGTGYYQQSHYPSDVATSTIETMAAIMVREVTEGVDGSGVRAGVIGEIGTSPGQITVDEERVVRASARAALRTGAPVSMHTPLGDQGLAQAAILSGEGLPADRVAIGHLDLRPDPDYHAALAEMGFFVQFDTFGKSQYLSDEDRLKSVVALVDRGFEDQILLSCDISRRRYLRKYGGWGYAHLLETIVPMLRTRVGADAVRKILVDNPARFLAFAVPAGDRLEEESI